MEYQLQEAKGIGGVTLDRNQFIFKMLLKSRIQRMLKLLIRLV